MGIVLAAQHFALAGHRVVGFLPDFLLDLERVAGKKRVARLGIVDPSASADSSSFRKGFGASALPDDVLLLQQLVQDGVLVGTPPQDYDDAYCIKYAQSHNGFVVTNDQYRDHVSSFAGPEHRREREEQRQWTKTNLASFTFVGDEFLPNPIKARR